MHVDTIKTGDTDTDEKGGDAEPVVATHGWDFDGQPDILPETEDDDLESLPYDE